MVKLSAKENVFLKEPPNVHGFRVAVLVADGFEFVEFDTPVIALRQAGAEVEVLGANREVLKNGIRGYEQMNITDPIGAHGNIIDADPADYEALLIPGGAVSCDELRTSTFHLALVRNFFDHNKPVGIISHGGWVLADAGVLANRTLTSTPSIRKDLERAGAIWRNEAVVEDGNLISSAGIENLEKFSSTFIDLLSKTVRRQVRAA